MATADEPGTRAVPRWAKICLALGIVLVVLAAGAIVAGKVLINRYEDSVSKGSILATEARPSSQPAYQEVSGPLDFLLLGSDYRSGSPGEGQRADTIVVVHVPRSMDRTYLVSIPRDLLVDIPPNPATSFGGHQE